MDKDRIKLDRMRYVKDNMPSNFAILAIVFDVLYFVIGISIIVNLLFMLFGFWSSIEVKNYHGKFGYFMIALGVVQIIRIFIYPMRAHAATYLGPDGSAVPVMNNSQFMLSIVYLCAAAGFMILGGLMSIKNSRTLQNYLDSIEKK